MKKILFGNEARTKIKQGIDKCVDVVKVSLGGQGKNVLIYNGVKTEIINDGVSIAREVNVKDEVEQAGIQLAKQCANQTNEDAGDGTTTTLVLLQQILNEIIKEIQTENPRELREKLFAEAKEVLAKVEVQQIQGKEDVYNLALTSSLDKDIAKMISEIYEELGKDAQISIEETHRNVLEKEIIKGVKFESQNPIPKMLRNSDKRILEGSRIIVKDKIETTKDYELEVQEAVKSGCKSVVIIANSFAKNVVLSMLDITNFTIIPVEYTMMRPIDDIETYVGKEPVEKIIIEKEFTTIVGGKGNVDDLIATLKNRVETEESMYEKENLENRVAQLQGKIAVIRIGKNTDVERTEAVLKLEDAIGAVKGAYEMGYCLGGGLGLKNTGYRFNIYDQICNNAGDQVGVPPEVIDSFKTVKYSLLNAISTATSILMIESALIEERDDD